jgi:hypothetical protein
MKMTMDVSASVSMSVSVNDRDPNLEVRHLPLATSNHRQRRLHLRLSD